MVGTRLEDIFPDRNERKSSDEIILEVKNLEKKDRLHTINFNIRKGGILGLAGLEGCGIEDIMRILFGLERKEKGDIVYKGERYEDITPWKAIDKGLAMVPAERHKQGLMTEWSIRDNITISIIDRLLGIMRLVKRNEVNRIAKNMTKRLDIVTDSIHKKVLQLSGGNQQKVVIAKWLATEPELIILNDPTRGIDVGAKKEIYRLIHELAKTGHAILFTSSEFDETIELCDEIIVIYDGKISKTFKGSEVKKNELMSYVTGGGTCAEAI
jgi:ribose transport system ATP-binding protein